MDKLTIDGLNFTGTCISLPTGKILIINGSKSLLGCGYISVETADKLGQPLAVVTGVKNYDDMLAATVAKVSTAAVALGISCGMTGRQALILMEKGN